MERRGNKPILQCKCCQKCVIFISLATLTSHIFPQALSQWGTDFEMIARLFPHRNRRQVKLKFSREERVNPDKVTEYIIRKNKPIGKLI